MESTAKIVWRLEQKRFAKSAFRGHGSARYPGRWNVSGAPVVCCSETISLATLELLVNISPAILGKLDYVAVSAIIPKKVFDGRQIVTIEKANEIHKNWNDTPSPETLKSFGSDWHKNQVSVILEVPSAVIPQESNFVLNPYHPDFKKLKVQVPELTHFDSRIGKLLGEHKPK